MSGEIVARDPGQGQAYWMLGGLYEVKVSGAETDGTLTIMQMTMPAGMGPPPHRHNGDESVYVLDGRINYHIEGEDHEAGPGSSFHLPRGTLENFEPLEDSRVLVIYTPSGNMEEFFAEAGEPAQRREVPPAPTSPPDVERLTAVAQKYGLEIVAPASV
jgi:quercetin dioxygenase-like cupin family protein